LKRLSGAVLAAAEMQAAELASKVPLDALMDRAGNALAEAVLRFGGGAATLVVCGPGNNGGDGYVAARILADHGVPVRVAASGLPNTALAQAAAARWAGEICNLTDAAASQVLVDALFGTGTTHALDDDTVSALQRLGSAARLVIAADLPSGVGSDDGCDYGAIRADVTIAFAAAKPAHLLQPAAAKCGTILVADIGIDVSSSASVLERPSLSSPSPNDHKYSRGMVAVVSGDMPGAATLGATAAARIAGYTILCGKGDAPAAVVRRGFDAVLNDKRLSAVLIGPGLSDTEGNRVKLATAMASAVPLVLDAGALAMLTPAQIAKRQATTVLTPHEGEFDRLFGGVAGSKIDRARAAALASGATVIFKGADTVIASPDGRVTLAPAASVWLATAGAGDVLAGIVIGLLGRGMAPHDAACAAVWLHGDAAKRAGPGLIADDLSGHIPAAIASCL
jgi:ADP-dependent NAD(P)H-hydrate dehydratase / NAD(P)H-hydrate epimerase